MQIKYSFIQLQRVSQCVGVDAFALQLHESFAIMVFKHSVFGGRVTDDTDLCDFEKNSNKLSSEIITQVILLMSFGC